MPFLIGRFGLVDYGVYLLAGSLSVYLGLLDFGVGLTVMKYVAEFRAKGDDEDLGRVVSNVAMYYVAVGVVASAALLLFSRYGIGIFRLSPSGAQLASRLFAVSGVIALFAWPLSVGGFVLNGLQRYDLSARVGSLVVIGNVVATAAVLVAGEGPLVLLAATGFVGLLGGLSYSVLAKRELGAAPLSLRLVSLDYLRFIFSFSWVVFVMQVASVIVYQQTDRMVLGVFVGAAAVGLYEAASKMHGLVTQLAQMPGAAVLPAASQFDAQERTETLRELLIRGTKYTNVFVLPIAASLIVLAYPLLRTWLGPVLATQSTAAQIFVGYWLIWVNIVVAMTMMLGAGKLRFMLWFTIAQASLNLVLSIILVRQLHVLGVILGTAISNMVLFPIGMRYVLRWLDISAAEWFRRVVFRTYPMLVLPVIVGIAGIALGLTERLLGVAAVGLLGVATYWAAVYAFGLEPNERADVRVLVGSVRTRLGFDRGM